jgi:hypothetical protein
MGFSVQGLGSSLKWFPNDVEPSERGFVRLWAWKQTWGEERNL